MLLQTASKTILDYDETQSGMAESLSLQYTRLPQGVLDAFSQDCGSLSSGTRKGVTGWRCVEETFERSEKQRKILRKYVKSRSVKPSSLPQVGIYEKETKALSDLVEELHKQRSVVLSRVRSAGELLKEVKKLRDVLKPEFDAAGKYTSANYPEVGSRLLFFCGTRLKMSISLFVWKLYWTSSLINEIDSGKLVKPRCPWPSAP